MARRPRLKKQAWKPGEPGKKTLARIDIQLRAERLAQQIIRLAMKQGRPPAHYLKRLKRTRIIRNFHGRKATIRRVTNELLQLGVRTYEPVDRMMIREQEFALNF